MLFNSINYGGKELILTLFVIACFAFYNNSFSMETTNLGNFFTISFK